ncbi:Uma2 family endonuclease [Pseudonocardiaceae bacterium YIM PH 21723]|nr:Uma2 family endonuclease [Pseudonocardiaceae bacterium YIM PH 21723]
MTLMVEIGSTSGSLTVKDLEGMPDDGHRYELIDGELLMSPAPSTKHQKVSMRLGALLEAACPAGLHVFAAPFAYRPDFRNEVQPDLLVVREEDLDERCAFGPPLLVVEILSPGSMLSDLNKKKLFYQRMGVPGYWVVDPLAPGIVELRLDDAGQYHESAVFEAEDTFGVERPYPFTIVLRELLGTLRGL